MSVLNFEFYNAINSGFGTQYAYEAVCWKRTAGFLIWHRKRCKMSGT